MMERMPIGGHVTRAGLEAGVTRIIRTGSDLTFSDVLRTRFERESGITLSAHASQRLDERGIHLEQHQFERLADAVDRAGKKGAHDSLIVVDDLAFIVSVENRTVITAITGETLKDNVFTNIDSAVLA